MKRRSTEEKINTIRERQKNRSEHETSRLHRGLGVASLLIATGIAAGLPPTATIAEHRVSKPSVTTTEAGPDMESKLEAELKSAYNHPWVSQVENTHKTIEHDGKRAIIAIHLKDAAKNTEADHPDVTYDPELIDKAISMQTPGGSVKLFTGGEAILKAPQEGGARDIEAYIRQANFNTREEVTVKYELAFGAQAGIGDQVLHAKYPLGILSVSGNHNKVTNIEFSSPPSDEVIITNE